MPELPEVETIVRSLRNPPGNHFSDDLNLNSRPGILGRKISDVQINWRKTIAEPSPEEFSFRIAGQAVLSVNRRGKFIVVGLTRDSLLLHLRMSGDIRIERNDDTLLSKHDQLVLNFIDGARMVFNDSRKFGRAWLTENPQTVLGGLGEEPFSPELTYEVFHHKLLTRKRAIKPLLLDQSFLAGMGNIYTDEVLFRAKIHPLTISNQVTSSQAVTLLQSIREVLEEGIRRNGASIDWVYRGGDFQNYFKVYQRTGEVCYQCGTMIERVLVGQRGTHFCPNCQKQYE